MSCFIITDVTAYLPDGPAEHTFVQVVDGRIAAIDATTAPAGCVKVDGLGKQLTAGLFDPHTDLGINEIDLEDVTANADAGQSDPIRAGLRVADAYDPDSIVIPVQRIYGITTARIAPSGGLVSGQSAIVTLAGGTQAKTLVKPVAGVDVRIGVSANKAYDLELLRDLLGQARSFAKNKAGWQATSAQPSDGVTYADLEAMQPVLNRAVPLVVHVDRSADIEALLRLVDEQNVRVVIEGGAEAWQLADELARRKIPVIIDPYVSGAGSFDQTDGRADNAVILDAAGVAVSFSTFQGHNARTLPQLAGNAVRAGLSHDRAVLAITQHPADAFGLGDRGRIAPGAVADLVLWGGDPLEIGTTVDSVWIGGEPIALRSRQEALLEKYRTLPGTPLDPLPVQ